jgi:hypothetical protein
VDAEQEKSYRAKNQTRASQQDISWAKDRKLVRAFGSESIIGRIYPSGEATNFDFSILAE